MAGVEYMYIYVHVVSIFQADSIHIMIILLIPFRSYPILTLLTCTHYSLILQPFHLRKLVLVKL